MQQDPVKLLEKYKAGNCSHKEKAIVESWYLELQSEKEVPTHAIIENTKDEVWAFLSANKNKPVKIRSLASGYLRKVSIWTAVIFTVASVGLLYFNKTRMPNIVTHITKSNDVAPGGNKAFLTLADGRKISLTDAANGEIVKQDELIISKTADGQLVYTVANTDIVGKKRTALFNTIETPNGGQYQINLPDGTRVWLNAASSLHYPTKFIGNTRTVELTGEGYFEVAKLSSEDQVSGNKIARRIPFIVKCGEQEVEVLGTHFNINSYKDEEDIRTTLLEGSVLVLPQNQQIAAIHTIQLGNRGKGVVLKPGEQSQLNKNSINVKAVDAETVLAWKGGDFVFDGDDLKSIMRKVARWYNVEVVYKGDFDNLKFGGYISRSKNISSVLGIMESTGKVRFNITGKKITVWRDNVKQSK